MVYNKKKWLNGLYYYFKLCLVINNELLHSPILVLLYLIFLIIHPFLLNNFIFSLIKYFNELLFGIDGLTIINEQNNDDNNNDDKRNLLFINDIIDNIDDKNDLFNKIDEQYAPLLFILYTTNSSKFGNKFTNNCKFNVPSDAKKIESNDLNP